MGLLLPKKEYDDIEWSKPDRQPNVLYGYNKDRKCKVVKIGLQTPEVPKGYIRLEQPSQKTKEFEMHSFTRYYYNRLTQQFMSVPSNVLGTTGGAGYLNIKKTNNTWDTATSYYNTNLNRAESQDSNNWGTAQNIVTSGILIGSNSSGFSFDDYNLSTYADGYGEGNIIHSVNTPFVVSYDSGTRVWTVNHSRFFNNFSGGTINNINELGIIINDTNTFKYLEERSVLVSPITLLNKECLRTRYQRQYTFPSSVDWNRNAYVIWLVLSAMCATVNATNFGDGYRSVKDTGGTVRGTSTTHSVNMYDGENNLGYTEGANASTYGILVGTGNTAESLDDYALGTKVAHSASFTYAANNRLTTTYTTLTKTYLTQWSRQVTNVSAGSTTIAEIGLVGRMGVAAANSILILVARKVLASSVTLANGESLQVIYEISSVYPS